jgi:hypothetical protein
MKKTQHYAGLDVHKNTIMIAAAARARFAFKDRSAATCT